MSKINNEIQNSVNNSCAVATEAHETGTIIETLQAALPALEAKIESLTGHKVKLHAKTIKDWSGEEYYNFFSDDFSAELGGLAKPIFESIHISTSGGKFTEDADVMWFSPNVKYTHYSGGSNGTNYIWSCLYFNIAKGEWDFEHSRQIFSR